MDVTYIKLFVDYRDAIEPLDDAERGRLFTALLMYAQTGEAPELSGNERFLFPMMRAQIDRDAESLEAKSQTMSENGKKGGRPSKAKKAKAFDEKQKKQKLFPESRKSKDKDKEEDKDKDKDKDKDESKEKRQSRFSPPARVEVADFCAENGLAIDPDAFLDYYAQQGWRLSNGNAMKDWRSAARNWARRDRTRGSPRKNAPAPAGMMGYSQPLSAERAAELRANDDRLRALLKGRENSA